MTICQPHRPAPDSRRRSARVGLRLDIGIAKRKGRLEEVDDGLSIDVEAGLVGIEVCHDVLTSSFEYVQAIVKTLDLRAVDQNLVRTESALAGELLRLEGALAMAASAVPARTPRADRRQEHCPTPRTPCSSCFRHSDGIPRRSSLAKDRRRVNANDPGG